MSKNILIFIALIVTFVITTAFLGTMALKGNDRVLIGVGEQTIKVLSSFQSITNTIIHNQGVLIQNGMIINHNEEIIIHNQGQFAKFGMVNNGTATTPDIRDDFQKTVSDYWKFTNNDKLINNNDKD